MQKLPEFTGMNIHSGRKGGNVLNIAEGVAIARTLISMATAGLILLRDVSPTPPDGVTQQSKIDFLTEAADKVESGEYELVGVESRFAMFAGDHRRSSVHIVYKVPSEHHNRSITASWRLPD